MPYIINTKTLALIPKGPKTEIYEAEKIRILPENTIKIIENNCIYNGSSLEGRQKGSIYLIGSPYKTPIIINDIEEIIMIPTHSPRNKYCAWINLTNLLNYNKNDENSIIIVFNNYKKIKLNISYAIFDRQVMRATRLESALRGRKNKKSL